MAFELAPDIEQSIRLAAARKGLAIEELLRQTFAPTFTQVLQPAVEPREARTETKEETRARVMTTLHNMQKEYGLPPRPDGEQGHTTLAELSARWAEEDAHLTDEEWEAERQFWEEFNRERSNRPLEI